MLISVVHFVQIQNRKPPGPSAVSDGQMDDQGIHSHHIPDDEDKDGSRNVWVLFSRRGNLKGILSKLALFGR
jgi:hypothetical protein